jgi:hypothetical protein
MKFAAKRLIAPAGAETIPTRPHDGTGASRDAFGARATSDMWTASARHLRAPVVEGARRPDWVGGDPDRPVVLGERI